MPGYMHTPTCAQVARPAQVTNSLARQTLPQIPPQIQMQMRVTCCKQTLRDEGTAPQTGCPCPMLGTTGHI